MEQLMGEATYKVFNEKTGKVYYSDLDHDSAIFLLAGLLQARGFTGDEPDCHLTIALEQSEGNN